MSNLDSRLTKAETQIFPMPKRWMDEYNKLSRNDEPLTKAKIRRIYEMTLPLSVEQLVDIAEFYHGFLDANGREIVDRYRDTDFADLDKNLAASAGITIQELWLLRNEVCIQVTGQSTLERCVNLRDDERAFLMQIESEKENEH